MFCNFIMFENFIISLGIQKYLDLVRKGHSVPFLQDPSPKPQAVVPPPQLPAAVYSQTNDVISQVSLPLQQATNTQQQELPLPEQKVPEPK